MTFEIACKSCGTTLYSGFELRSPDDVLRAFGYKCRKCGTRLTSEKFNLEIKKLDGSYV